MAELLDSVDDQETKYSQLTSDINLAEQNAEVAVLPEKHIKKALKVWRRACSESDTWAYSYTNVGTITLLGLIV